MMPEKPDLPGYDDWAKIEGTPWPMGATWVPSLRSYNFALYSRHARGVILLLFAEEDPAAPVFQYRFDPILNKTGHTWHCLLSAENTNGATLYGYKVEGPFDLAEGHRFDPQKVLLDPFALSVFIPPAFSRDAASKPGPNDGMALLGRLPATERDLNQFGYDKPRHTHDLVVYELHVKGFTNRPNSGVSPEKRGTFAGLVERIPYLQELGVTAVELLPVQQYDPQEGNYWGYMTLNFFAPHRDYASGDPVVEFREMVNAFHVAGIEVWLDVVYNHTSEGDGFGPTYCYRGIDNRSYYLHSPDRRSYNNDTGCGNTLNCAQPAVRALILLSLIHWTQEMQVDGFRFDLASIFTRRSDGTVNYEDPPLISEITLLGYLNNLRLVAEAWDIGAYLLGRGFPGLQWRQWNGQFRDDVRAFVKGEPGKVGALMQRLYGSDDLFPEGPNEVYRPSQSINFITAHDGFCLYDLVSYNCKHNEANGHANTDGTDDNLSWNCGWEGDAAVPEDVATLRRRQVKNFFSLLMLSNGTPMFCAGDEFLNTQRGNNNPYNQDNEITWLDWDLLERNRDIFRFFKLMISFRKAHPYIASSRYWREAVRWYGATGNVDFSPHSRTLAYCLHGGAAHISDIYVMINAYWEDIPFRVQEGMAEEWRQVLNTALPSPDDIAEAGRGEVIESLNCMVRSRSIVVLERTRGAAAYP